MTDEAETRESVKRGLSSNMRDAIRKIQAIDPDASLRFSPYTQKWYVSARIEISNGALLTGFTEHDEDPWTALFNYLRRMEAVDVQHPDEVLVSSAATGERRHYRYNGGAFAEERVDLVAS